MFAAALVVFREVLEASLVISIILAATRGVPHRTQWVALGVTGGLIGAGLVAALTGFIASAFDGIGQEVVNALILFLAVGLIGWHVVWMNSHGREIAKHMRKVGHEVAGGGKHMSILAIVVGLAVLREGSEVVLILEGLWTNDSMFSMLSGGAMGFAAGALIGALIYAGLVKLSVGRMFTFTNALLTLIAAGMAARAANFLAQADLLPSLSTQVWDTSAILSDEGMVGKFFAALVGYIAQPNGIEVAFYAATVALISVLTFTTAREKTLDIKAVATVTLALTGAAAFLSTKI